MSTAARFSSKILFWQCIVAVTLALCLTCVPFSFFIKYFVDIFSTGRSDFKIIFFLCFVFTALQLRHLPLAKLPRILPLFNLVLATVLFFLGVLEFFSFNNRFFSDPPHIVETIYQHSISSTRFYHIHNAKAVMAWALQWLPPGFIRHYDFGLPYLPFIPPGLIAAHSVLYALFFILTIYQLRAYDRLSLGLYALFAMCCFIVLRNQLDGGIFFCESLVAFPIYATLQWQLFRQDQRTITTTARVWVPVLTIYLIIGAFVLHSYLSADQWLTDPPLRYLALCMLLFTIYTAFNSYETLRTWRAVGVAIAFVATFILLGVSGLYTSWGTYQLAFITQKIAGDFTAIVPQEALPRVNADTNFTVSLVQKVGSIALVTARAKSPTYLWQLQNEWGIHIDYGFVDVHQVSCIPGSGYTSTGNLYILSSDRIIHGLVKKYGDIKFTLTPVKSELPYPKYSLKLDLPGCTPDRIEILKAIFWDTGIKFSVVRIDNQEL